MQGVNPEGEFEQPLPVHRLQTRRPFVAASFILAGLLVLSACGDDDSAGPETTIPLIGADDDADAQEAFSTVETAFAAFNSGDMDTWALWREGGPGTGADFSYELAAESRIDIEQCTSRGLAEWEMDGSMTGHGFDCDVTQTDLLLEAAGIELEMTHVWVIGADPESSLGGSNGNYGFVGEFMVDYRAWLATNHPDAAASIEYPPERVLPSAEGVLTAVEYIDEFVAQSDSYPLTEPVQSADYGGPLERVTASVP